MSKQTEALQAAKKALKRLHNSVFHEHGEEEIKDALDNAYGTIAMIESALSDDGWISYKDKLPEKVCNVYVCNDENKVRPAIYSHEDKSFWYGVMPADNIKYWKELIVPQPPKSK